MSKTVQASDHDCIHSIAYREGMKADKLWDSNEALSKAGRDPFVLKEGDTVKLTRFAVPSHQVQTAKTHRFKLHGTSMRMQVQLASAGRPMAKRKATVSIDGKPAKVYFTDAQGWLSFRISPGAQKATIEPEGFPTPYTLELGRMDPVNEISGVQQRLQTLGYYRGRVDDEAGPITDDALVRFRRAQGLPAIDKPAYETLVDSDVKERLEALTRGKPRS